MHPLEDVYQSAMRLHQCGDFDQAELLYRRVLQADSSFARAWHLLGVMRHQRGDSVGGLALIEHAMSLDRSYSVFHSNAARILVHLGRVAEAEQRLREACVLHPGDAHLSGLLGWALCAQDRAFEALPYLQAGLQATPISLETALTLGWAWAELGKVEESLAAYAQARDAGSTLGAIRWATQLPLVYRDRADIEAWRSRWHGEVQRLLDAGHSLTIGAELASPVFGLAYHGQKEVEHQRMLARLYRVPELPRPAPTPPSAARGKIHVAFTSAFFSSHTIGKLMRGFITHLSRDRFFVSVVSVGRRHEGEYADALRAAADLHLDLPADWRRARSLLAQLAPDILFYPELGMDNLTYTLALERLAPVQCAWWGHPLTTGLPTIDAFVSSSWIEPDDAQSHYSENLALLPAITFYQRPPEPVRRLTRSSLGLSERDRIYLCPQSIYKLHPDIDAIFAEILRRDPSGKIVLIRWIHDWCDQLLRDRFALHMPDVAERIVFIRRLTQAEYLDLLPLADVLLDPLHFGGGNTSYEAFAQGLPIVTLPAPFFRGRITFGLYRQIDMLDLVAHDESHYVELALRLGSDHEFRRAMSERIRERSDRLFEDMQAVRALERFLQAQR